MTAFTETPTEILNLTDSVSSKLNIVNYDNMFYMAQHNVWRLLYNDLSITAYTKNQATHNVYKAIPKALSKSLGFPYIYIPIPLIDESKLCFTTIENVLVFHIEVVGTRLDKLSKLASLVREVLKANMVAIGKKKIDCPINISSSFDTSTFDDTTILYTITLNVEYRWYGEY